MPTLYVIRHGEPAVSGVLLGQSNPPLSAIGRRQAASLAGMLPPCAVYSSPLARALETAACLTSNPIILPQLAEISYGEWDGLSWEEIEANWPDKAREKLNDWEGVLAPRGESWRPFRRRIRAALSMVRNGSFPAAVVAHEAVNAAIAEELSGAAIQSYKQKHCQIVTYEIRTG